jgi:SAM-dependent MidA family methyltransferase
MSSWLAEVVRFEGGRVSFERFMELALYHPVHGYYTGSVSSVGRSGDFSTATTIGDALIQAVARWAKAEAKYFSMPIAQVIELGGGTGRLAAGVLRAFKPWQRVRYQIVEVSKTLRYLQQQALKGRSVEWRDSVEAALAVAKGAAVLVSNEFVDAFPCQRFERGPEGWRELFLVLESDLWKEETVPNKALAPSSTLEMECEIGQRVETFLSYRNWLAVLSSHLQRGAMLTIDYGGSPHEVYRRRPHGTMRAYFRHQRFDGMGVYLRPGRQDITADVNFIDLKNWGEEFGLHTVQSMTQLEFIRTWARPRPGSQSLADQFMMDEAGMGEAFKVLHQRKVR